MDISGIRVIQGLEPVGGRKVCAGDRLRIDSRFECRSKSVLHLTLRGAIGRWEPPVFTPVIMADSVPLRLQKVAEFTEVSLSVEVPITEAIAPGTNYDLQVSLKGFPQAGDLVVEDVVDIYDKV